MKNITTSKLIILSAIFFVAFTNISFFSNVIEVYPIIQKNLLFLGSLSLVLTCVIIFLLSLVCYKHTVKPVLIVLFLISSITSYFMDSYNVVIDHLMIQNIIKTDMAESFDLVSLKLVLYFVILGIIPSIFVYRVNIKYYPSKKEFIAHLKLSLLSLIIIFSTIMLLSNFYASFFREHKPLRYYTNPVYYIYSTGKYINGLFKKASIPLKRIGLDAIIPLDDTKRELIVLVVGEAARADRFSLNGYARKTNPLLQQKENLISFSNFWSCGTSTAISVPCMFSIYGKSKFTNEKGDTTENLLDILQRAGVDVLWRDNNSDSKGVALRVNYQDYKTPKMNPICDIECRDEGMLSGLQDYIDAHEKGDIFILLHQMGNHGPAYYKRYPPSFEKYTPVCKTNQLEDCTKEEIGNAYDNAILYTDYFLSKVIDFLETNNTSFETAMFYIGDHGESLGENGLYLHGLPNILAPDAQKHIPFIMWFGESFDKEEIRFNTLKEKIHNEYSHDNIFHTILSLMEVETSVYVKEMDIIQHNE
ncbi:MAG: phosphoethanolamine--lipid A transferase [Desulfamplus sp.]|nr:phosphoethanolamine--lipid A transferase [Desulfamplus sp.]